MVCLVDGLWSWVDGRWFVWSMGGWSWSIVDPHLSSMVTARMDITTARIDRPTRDHDQ